MALEQKAAALWVLEDNHLARSFYETIGARVIGFREDVRTDATLNEVAYGWEDLSKDLLIPDGHFSADRGVLRIGDLVPIAARVLKGIYLCPITRHSFIADDLTKSASMRLSGF